MNTNIPPKLKKPRTLKPPIWFILMLTALAIAATGPVIIRLGDLNDVRIPVASVRTNATALVWDTNTLRFILGNAVGSSSSSTNSSPPVWENYVLNQPYTNTSTAARIYHFSGVHSNNATAGTSLISIYGNDTGAAAVTNRYPHRIVFTTTPGTNNWTADIMIGAGGRFYITNETAVAGTSNILATAYTGYVNLSGTNGLTGATGTALGNTNGTAQAFNVPGLTNWGAETVLGSVTNAAAVNNAVAVTNWDIVHIYNTITLGTNAAHSAAIRFGDYQGVSAQRNFILMNNSGVFDLAFANESYSIINRPLRVNGSNGTFTVSAGLVLPNITASRAVVIDGSGNITNVAGTPDGTKFLRDDNTYAVPSGGGSGTTNNQVLTGTNQFQGAFGGIEQPAVGAHIAYGTNSVWMFTVTNSSGFAVGVSGLIKDWNYTLKFTTTNGAVLSPTWTNVNTIVGNGGPTNLAANTVSSFRVIYDGSNTIAYALNDTNTPALLTDVVVATNTLAARLDYSALTGAVYYASASALAGMPGPGTSASAVTNTPTSGDVFNSWQFSASATNTVRFQFALPPDIDTNAAVYLVTQWTGSGGPAAGTNNSAALTNIISASVAGLNTAYSTPVHVTNKWDTSALADWRTNAIIGPITMAGLVRAGDTVNVRVSTLVATPFSRTNTSYLLSAELRYVKRTNQITQSFNP